MRDRFGSQPQLGPHHAPTFAGLIVDPPTLCVDPVNNFIGLGIATPLCRLDVSGLGYFRPHVYSQISSLGLQFYYDSASDLGVMAVKDAANNIATKDILFGARRYLYQAAAGGLLYFDLGGGIPAYGSIAAYAVCVYNTNPVINLNTVSPGQESGFLFSQGAGNVWGLIKNSSDMFQIRCIGAGSRNDLNIVYSTGSIGIGTIAPLAKLAINGGVHVGGDSDPGDNNLLVDGTTTISGLTASLPVFTDASKVLISKSVADTRTALGLGTADSPTFAGATLGSLAGFLFGTAGVVSALAGSARMSIGTTTHDVSITGTQALSGLGFQPTAVILLAFINTTVAGSFGVDSGSVHACMTNYGAITASAWSIVGTLSIYLIVTDPNRAHAYISSMDSSGFTLTWTKDGAPTGTASIIYLAFR